MRRFAPLPADHALIGETCPACRKPFAAGDETTLVPLGPGDDPEGQKAALEGRAYNAVAAPVHWLCAGGSPARDAPDAADDTAAQLISMLRSREQRILELQEALASELGECGREGIALRLEQEQAQLKLAASDLERERAARRLVDLAFEQAVRARDEALARAERAERAAGVATQALCAVANREGRLRLRLARALRGVGGGGRVWSRRLAP